MDSFRDIIAKWPSIEALADDVGAKPVAVLKWRVRDAIPARYWQALVWAARERKIEGVTFDKLYQLIGAQRPPQRPQRVA